LGPSGKGRVTKKGKFMGRGKLKSREPAVKLENRLTSALSTGEEEKGAVNPGKSGERGGVVSGHDQKWGGRSYDQAGTATAGGSCRQKETRLGREEPERRRSFAWGTTRNCL